MSTEREDEKISKSTFHKFLLRFFSESDISWGEKNNDDPPDYFLYLSGQEFAVEVTRVMLKRRGGHNIR
jgi:hypothetical protein